MTRENLLPEITDQALLHTWLKFHNVKNETKNYFIKFSGRNEQVIRFNETICWTISKNYLFSNALIFTLLPLEILFVNGNFRANLAGFGGKCRVCALALATRW